MTEHLVSDDTGFPDGPIIQDDIVYVQLKTGAGVHPREREKERLVRAVIHDVYPARKPRDPWKWWFDWCKSDDPHYGLLSQAERELRRTERR